MSGDNNHKELLLKKPKESRAIAHPVELEILPLRWSPRRGKFGLLSKDDILGIFEVARWAPSSYNEQEWRYIIETKDSDGYKELFACLTSSNQEWVKDWPCLGVLVAKTTFSHNGQPNKSAKFDCGISMGFLLAEATARGIACHLMAGFAAEKVKEIYGLTDEFEPVCCFTLGRFIDSSDDVTTRKPVDEVLFFGKTDWLNRGIK